jgi:hypothetical protein
MDIGMLTVSKIYADFMIDLVYYQLYDKLYLLFVGKCDFINLCNLMM